MTELYRVKISGGNHFITNKKETADRYKQRAKNAERVKISITKIKK